MAEHEHEPKKEVIQVRISLTEKSEMKECAQQNGFDHISAFLLWLFRKYGKQTKE